MKVGDQYYKSIWLDESDPTVIMVIDQQKLPFKFEIRELRSVEDVFQAISEMTVRGAPLIGATGAFGIYLAALEMTSTSNPVMHLENASRYLISCRPTAVNLSWAVNHVMAKLRSLKDPGSLSKIALDTALEIVEKEKQNCLNIGRHGLKLIETISNTKRGEPVNILTHCNAGWLACIDYGTALAPIYLAHEAGIPVHVWVDETRPRNQGSMLTAWELGQAGVSYTLIADNTGGHLMQHGMVDLVIVGCDRATAKGDVANKIGTYLKALAAYDNHVPFYSAFPTTSFDLALSDGIAEIPVEERDPEEVLTVSGFSGGNIISVKISPEESRAINYSFDVTPAKYITGLITERGICKATKKDIQILLSNKNK
jgi:methylthioribose-1-phosphate isomerase